MRKILFDFPHQDSVKWRKPKKQTSSTDHINLFLVSCERLSFLLPISSSDFQFVSIWLWDGLDLHLLSFLISTTRSHFSIAFSSSTSSTISLLLLSSLMSWSAGKRRSLGLSNSLHFSHRIHTRSNFSSLPYNTSIYTSLLPLLSILLKFPFSFGLFLADPTTQSWDSSPSTSDSTSSKAILQSSSFCLWYEEDAPHSRRWRIERKETKRNERKKNGNQMRNGTQTHLFFHRNRDYFFSSPSSHPCFLTFASFYHSRNSGPEPSFFCSYPKLMPKEADEFVQEEFLHNSNCSSSVFETRPTGDSWENEK